METKADIQDKRARRLAGRISIVTAHCLSTILQASRIVVLHKEFVAEISMHKELLAKGSIYAQMRQLQALT